MKQITSPGSMHETRCSGLVHWDDPEGWDGEEGARGFQDGGTHVHPWLIHVNVWQKPLTPWKESYNQPRWHIQKQRHYFANKCSSDTTEQLI